MELEPQIEYEPPAIIDYGNLAEITAGQSHGHHSGDPVLHGQHSDHLTFSNA